MAQVKMHNYLVYRYTQSSLMGTTRVVQRRHKLICQCLDSTLRRLCLGAGNILSLSKDDHLPHLSELRELRADMVSLSETRKLGIIEIISGGYTYYWLGQSNGAHLRMVAVAISCCLQSSAVAITLVDEHIMTVRLKQPLGFTSLTAICAPTEMCKLEERDVCQARSCG